MSAAKKKSNPTAGSGVKSIPKPLTTDSVYKTEVSCQVIYQYDDIGSAVDLISLNPSIMRQLGLKTGSKVCVTSGSKKLILSAWTSSNTANNNTAIISRKLKPSILSDNVVIATNMIDYRILPCFTVICHILAVNDIHGTQKDYITFELQNLMVTDSGLQLEVPWKGSPILITVTPKIDDINSSFSNNSKTVYYEIHEDTKFEFQSISKNGDSSSGNCVPLYVMKPAGYDQEIQQAIAYLELGIEKVEMIHANSNNNNASNSVSNSSSSSSSSSSRSSSSLLLQNISKPPRGLIIKGLPGSGKSMVMKYLASVIKCSLFEVKADILLQKTNGETELKLQAIFTEAIKRSTSCILFDDLDLICPHRSDSHISDSQKRFVSCLLRLIDQSSANRVVLIATTSRPNSIDKAIRRPGRFDKELEINIPSAAQRNNILSSIFEKQSIRVVKEVESSGNGNNNDSKDSKHIKRYNEYEKDVTAEVILKVASITHGFVASDLVELIKEAFLINCDRKDDDNINSNNNINNCNLQSTGNGTSQVGDNNDASFNELESQFALMSPFQDRNKNINSNNNHNNGNNHHHNNNNNHNNNTVERNMPSPFSSSLYVSDLMQAVKRVSPSALREIVVEIPSVHWGDIGGMESVKQSLKEVIEWPILYASIFESMNLSPPQGVLLYGPPGCSKTLMAKALATESSMNFLSVRGPELLSKWLGESEKAVQTLFRRARSVAPAVIFFDEIDAFATKRGDSSAGVNDRVLSQLLTEIDETQRLKQVIVVAATNRPDLLDDALLRPGRIDRKIYVPPPDEKSRESILRIEIKKIPCLFEIDHFMEWMIFHTNGFSGAEIVSACQEAIMLCIDEDQNGLSEENLRKSILAIKPQITPEMISFYESMKKKFR